MDKIEPKVTLVNYTQDALELLVFTKSGRLKPGTTFNDIKCLSEHEKLEHWKYMMDTIQTSFEFVDYTFQIKNVSRAFTHQLVRTRTASFQQQAMRVVDARDFKYLVSTDNPKYQEAADNCFELYGEMLDEGVDTQDARGILPTAVHTEIFMKANLRTLANMAELRLCKRAEGEYQKVFKKIIEEVVIVHPWTAPLLKVYCVKYGICAFPRYTECPVQEFCIDPKEVRPVIEAAWESTNHVAAPKANKDAMTM